MRHFKLILAEDSLFETDAGAWRYASRIINESGVMAGERNWLAGTLLGSGSMPMRLLASLSHEIVSVLSSRTGGAAYEVILRRPRPDVSG